MSIENMFGDLDKIDILAETKTGEVVMVLVCNGFIDGSPETQKALLDKMEGYLNHTQSEEFQKEYGGWPVILRVTFGREPDEHILALLMPAQKGNPARADVYCAICDPLSKTEWGYSTPWKFTLSVIFLLTR